MEPVGTRPAGTRPMLLREKYLDPPVPRARRRIIRAIWPPIRDERLFHAPPLDRRLAGFYHIVRDQPMPHGPGTTQGERPVVFRAADPVGMPFNRYAEVQIQ